MLLHLWKGTAFCYKDDSQGTKITPVVVRLYSLFFINLVGIIFKQMTKKYGLACVVAALTLIDAYIQLAVPIVNRQYRNLCV